MAGEVALLIPILALSIPIFAIWSKHQLKMADKQVSATAQNTAERAAQYASQVAQLEDRCACWSASSPMAATKSPPGSRRCAT